MAIRRVSTASIKTGSKSNKFWDQDTAQGALEPIGQVIGNGTSSNMTFSNIPSHYRDLMLTVNATSNSSHSGNLIFNFASGGTYSATFLRGNGTSVLSSRVTGSGAGPILTSVTYGSATPISSVFHILNYANTTGFKSYILRNAADANGSGDSQIVLGLWQKTEAINEIILSTGSGSIFWTGMATLYGIRSGN